MADLAKLVVSLEAESTKLRTELEKTNKRLQRWEKRASRTMRRFKQNFRNAFIVGAGVAGVGSLFDLMGKLVTETDDANAAMKRLQAQIESTGYAAGLTAREVDDFARSLARNTLASVEGVREAAGALLSFKTVTGDTFRETLTVAQDMVAVFGTSLKGAAIQLGKALEDPATGLSALRESGVSFSQSEQDLIKTLQKSGQLFKAQGIILDKLREQVGGAGRAEASGTLVGALDSLGQAWDELFEKIGQSGIARAAIKFIDALTVRVNNLRNLIAGSDQDRFFDLADERKTIEDQLASAFKLPGTVEPLKNRLREIEAEMRQLQDRNIARMKERQKAAEGIAQTEIAAAQAVADAQDKIVDKLKKQKESFTDLIKETRDIINAPAVNPLTQGTVIEALRALDRARTLESAGDTRGVIDQATKAAETIRALAESNKITDQYANSLLQQIEALGATASDRLIELKLDDAALEAEAERARSLIQANFSATPFEATIEWTDPTTQGLEPLAQGATQNGTPIIFDLNGQRAEVVAIGEEVDQLRRMLVRENMKRGAKI